MADRVIGRDARISIDIPGLDGEDVAVEARDAVGATVVPAGSAADALGEGRYAYTIPAALMVRQGLWTATYSVVGSDPVRAVTQTFSVGRTLPAGVTKYDLRYQIAQRVEDAIEGLITDADAGSLTDDTLTGGAGNYRGWYVALDPSSAEAGKFKRVADFNGSALELSSPFLSAPASGQRYIVFNISPLEVDRAIATAISEVSQIARVSTQVTGVTPVNGAADVPEGLRYISEVYADDTRLDQSGWTLAPGRRLILASVTGVNALSLTGVRSLTPLLWEDSVLDIEPGVVIARAAQLLHANRAAGAGVDIDDHLRRQLTAASEFGDFRGRVSGRLEQGARAVID